MLRSCSVLAMASLAWVGSAQAQTPGVEEILRRYASAHGGSERWGEVQTLRMHGSLELGHEVGVPFVQEMKRPDKTRFEFVFRGETAVQAFDGTRAWKYRPYAGYDQPESVEGEELEESRRETSFDSPLLDAEAKGNTVELVGEGEADGREVYELKVTLANGAVQHIFLDKGSFTEVMVTRKRDVRGVPTDVTTHKSDHRWIGGLLLPFRFETEVAGSSQRRGLTVERVEVDVPIEDRRFEQPAG